MHDFIHLSTYESTKFNINILIKHTKFDTNILVIREKGNRVYTAYVRECCNEHKHTQLWSTKLIKSFWVFVVCPHGLYAASTYNETKELAINIKLQYIHFRYKDITKWVSCVVAFCRLAGKTAWGDS